MKLLLLSLLLACDVVTGPAFYAGPASISAVVPAGVPDTLRITDGWTGASIVAYEGDSLCMTVYTDGARHVSFIISNHNISQMYLDWYPNAFFRHVTVRGLGGGIARDNWRANLC